MNAILTSTFTVVLGLLATLPALGEDPPSDNRNQQEKKRDRIAKVERVELDPARAGRFDLVMFELTNNAWAAVRYNKLTGKSWIYDGEAWVAIQESADWEKRSRSNYQVSAVKFGPAKDYVVMRLNVDTGKSWRLKNKRWLPLAQFSGD